MLVRQARRQGRQEGLRRQRPQAQSAVRSDPVASPPVPLRQHAHLQQCMEDLPVQQLVRQLPVDTLDAAVLPPRPGSMQSVLAPTRPSHSRTARAANSGPLSEPIRSDTPLNTINSASTSVTSAERMLRAARRARHALPYSSMTVSNRTSVPSLSLTCIKSQAQNDELRGIHWDGRAMDGAIAKALLGR